MNYQVAVAERNSEIIFLHKIIKGGTDRSYGLHVAKIAGLPIEALKIAERKLKDLETQPGKILKTVVKEKEPSFPLFEIPPKHPVVEELKTLKIEHLTPIEALQQLFELQKLAKTST